MHPITPEEMADLFVTIPQTTYTPRSDEHLHELTHIPLVRDLGDAWRNENGMRLDLQVQCDLLITTNREAIDRIAALEGSLQTASERLSFQVQRAENKERTLREVWEAVIKATVAHDGCNNGKMEFVTACKVPEEMWPTVSVPVTLTYNTDVEIAWFGDEDERAGDSDFDEAVRDAFLNNTDDSYIIDEGEVEIG